MLDDDDDDFVCNTRKPRKMNTFVNYCNFNSVPVTVHETVYGENFVDQSESESLKLALLLQKQEMEVAQNYESMLLDQQAQDLKLAKALSLSLLAPKKARQKKFKISDDASVLAPSIVIPRQTEFWLNILNSPTSCSRNRDFSVILRKSKFDPELEKQNLYFYLCSS